MTRSTTIGSAALLATLGLAAPSLADDLTPPPWRFGPDTTFQHWDFSSGPNGGAPDAPGVNLFNPYGIPIMVPTSGTTWLPTFGGRNNVWALGGGGSLQFDIPNDLITANHQKELWLQITYFALAPSSPPSSVVSSNFGNFTPLGAPVVTVLPGGWAHQLTRWTLPFCPGVERVAIFPQLAGAQLFIDQVVIDTQCSPVPGPGSAALLALGGLVATRRRR